MSRLVRGTVRLGALSWLLLAQPADLAATLSRLVVRPAPLTGAVVVLVAARMSAVVLGLAAGIALARRVPAAGALTWWWLVAEATTLLAVWTTSIWPTNRPPGLLLPTVAVYLLGAGCVILAARTMDAPTANQARGDLPASPRSR